VLPGIPKAKVHARVVMTPQHTKMLLNALHDNIDKFEKKFGDIKIVGESPASSFGFQTPIKEEKFH
jgi:hypothetical protein